MTKKQKIERLKIIFNLDRSVFEELILVAKQYEKQDTRKEKLEKLRKIYEDEQL